jgi:NitT/TauT family transport system ATP-binding protein
MIIPKIDYTTLQGFLEVLDNLGSKTDLANVALKHGLALDDLLPIIEAGEMLGLISIQTGDVLLTEKGHLFIAASPRVRKKMLQEIMLNLDIFKKFVSYADKNGKDSMSKEDLLELVSNENSAVANDSRDLMSDVDWFIEWGRQGLVLKYNADNETISIRSKL